MRREITSRVIEITTVLAIACFAGASAHAQSDLQPVPVAQGFLADVAGVLSPEERTRISAKLRKLSQEKGSQLGVVIVKTTDPESLEEFAQRVFVTWKLGRKGIDDGVLLVLATDNKTRRMRIHVGYGLEGAIPDAIAKRILAEQMRPALEKFGAAAAINVGVDALLARMEPPSITLKNEPRKSEHAAVKKAVTAPPLEDSGLVAAGLRLMLGTMAQVVIFALAVWVLESRFQIRTKFMLGLIVGLVTCCLYIWVVGDWWAVIAAPVWLVIPAMVA